MSVILDDPCIANKAKGLFWCNGKKINCNKSFCYKNMGGCFCTVDPLFKAPFYEVLDSENRVNQYNYWNSVGNPKIHATKDSGIIVSKI